MKTKVGITDIYFHCLSASNPMRKPPQFPLAAPTMDFFSSCPRGLGNSWNSAGWFIYWILISFWSPEKSANMWNHMKTTKPYEILLWNHVKSSPVCFCQSWSSGRGMVLPQLPFKVASAWIVSPRGEGIIIGAFGGHQSAIFGEEWNITE